MVLMEKLNSAFKPNTPIFMEEIQKILDKIVTTDRPADENEYDRWYIYRIKIKGEKNVFKKTRIARF